MKYTLEFVKDFGLKGSKPTVTLLEHNQKLTIAEFDKTLQMKNDDKFLTGATIYQRLIGKLLYLKNTRPNIAYGV